MAVRNHQLTFRPLRPGGYIYNPLSNNSGTLGIAATTDGTDRWMISAYHVIGRFDMSACADGEPIFQPATEDGTVAVTDVRFSDRVRDFAAAKCLPGVQLSNDVLEFGPVVDVVAPQIGMRVIKSGANTGVTEGKILSVIGERVIIAAPDNAPREYTVTAEGDSGAAWIDLQTRAVVALNLGLSANGSTEARCIAMETVLSALQLNLL